MNTASAIRSAVAGKSERLQHRLYSATGLGEVFNDSNVHLSIKSSPEKTAPALSPLAEKEGTVVKLNDSGCWRKRRALLVPHTFLYYFAESTADTDLRPHGVIDLLLYTDVEVVDETVKLAPGDEMSPARTFYLRMSNTDEAEAWAQVIRETRFDCVRGERDALRSAKTCLTEQLESRAEELRECRESLAASRRRESAALSEVARRNADEARRVEQVRALLAASASASASASTPAPSSSFGDRLDPESSSGSSNRTEGSAGAQNPAAAVGGETSVDNDGSRLSDTGSNGIGGSGPREGPGGDVGRFAPMAAAIVGGRSSVAATALSELAALEEAIAERAQEVASLKMENKALREREALAVERRQREVADALQLRDRERERADEEEALRSDLEVELQHLRAQLSESRAGWEEARTNLGVVAAACREADAKSRELQEHRRVLAREVKASRAEQRRLSAALSCATAAAATAAARAAAARAEATAATAAAASSETAMPAGNRHRSSSASSRAAGDGGPATEVAPAAGENIGEGRTKDGDNNGGGEGAGRGGGAEAGDPAEQAADSGAREPSLRAPDSGEAREEDRRSGPRASGADTAALDEGGSADGRGRSSNELQPGRSSSTTASDSSDAHEPGWAEGGGDGGETTPVDGRAGVASLRVRPSSPDAVPRAVQQGEREEEVLVDGLDPCDATRPAGTVSPGVSDGAVSESGSVGGWGDAEDRRERLLEGEEPRVPSSPSKSGGGSSTPGGEEGGAPQSGEGGAHASGGDMPSAAERALRTDVNISVAGTVSGGRRGGRGEGGIEDCERWYDAGRGDEPGVCAEGCNEEGSIAEESNRAPPVLLSPEGDHQPATLIAGEEGSSSSSDGAASQLRPPTAAAEAPASPSTSLAAAFGESSSLRFNQMVQSLSAGLRESRKARRTPLLGSLDDDDDDDGGGGGGGGGELCAAAIDADEDDGGVTDGTGTDGTGTDGGDSHHDSISITTTKAVTGMTRKDSGGAWSAWSTVGGGESRGGNGRGGGGGGGGGGGCRSRGSSCHEPRRTLSGQEEEGQRTSGFLASAAAGGERADNHRCPAAEGRDVSVGAAPRAPPMPIPSLEGSVFGPAEAEVARPPPPPPTPPSSPSIAFPASATSAAVAADAIGSAAVKKTSEWLRVLGRPDGEDDGSETAEQEAPRDQQPRKNVDATSRSTPSSPPPEAERDARGGDPDGGIGPGVLRSDEECPASAAPPASSMATATAEDTSVEEDGGVGGAAVAVALAAAERGGRASAEAAAAARRWEAKLKGSLVSMAGGVRWGMGPQRITDGNFFKP